MPQSVRNIGSPKNGSVAVVTCDDGARSLRACEGKLPKGGHQKRRGLSRRRVDALITDMMGSMTSWGCKSTI